MVAGPADPDFATVAEGEKLVFPLRESLLPALPTGAVLTDLGGGQYRYTFATALPAGITGKWMVGMEGRRSVSGHPTRPFYDSANDTFAWPYTGESVSEAADNPIAWADAATGAMVPPDAPPPRRIIVDGAKCNRCHLRLVFHGGQRIDVVYCAACHTPERTDLETRPGMASAGVVDLARTYDNIEERSVHLKVMVHRIHTGGRTGYSDLSALEPFVQYGHNSNWTTSPYGNPRFRDRGAYPNDLADCRVCHVNGSYNVDRIPPGASPTVANETSTVHHHHTETHEAEEERVWPIAAACRGCHTSGHAIYHSTRYGATTGKQQCPSCHGPKGSYAAEKLHGIPLTEQ
jgi:OmcA/MtrC family decaheme c-type cytochrome